MKYIKVILGGIIGTVIGIIYQHFRFGVNWELISIIWIIGLILMLAHYLFIERKKNERS
ncbi:hypothetical protein [Oceanobacillus jeddahense]|uniref:Uncharacterized protein n=1 Tax=Oceanobacillus jeddahense TaxID=1462527 RepID=A0ABY5JRC8_9BACI|nr:hypothetical protein [Oceanobacillus jeddahense]UUI02850.1 hypothetical protein NP439_22920 [Oceanobacillus jeddahense]